jgi:hypothetical protein
MTKILFIFLAVAATLSAQKSRPQRVVNFTAGGSANAITGTPSPALAAYSDLSTTPLTQVCFTATATSTGTVTINLNALGAKALKKVTAGAVSDAGANDLVNGQVACAVYLSSPDYLMLTTPSGNLGAGVGGGSITLSDCYLASNCAHVGAPGRSALGTINTLRMMRIAVPGSLTLARLVAYFSGGGASSSANFAVYEDSSGVPGSKVANSEFRFTDLSSAAIRAVAPISGSATLTAGVYWLGWATEDASALVWTNNPAFTGPGSFLGSLPSNPGMVSCSNAPTGTGVTYALPASCTSPAAIVSDTQIPLVLASRY